MPWWDPSDGREWMRRVRDGLGPVIVTCAVNGGVQGKESHPSLPETVEEIAEQARRAYLAGASVVHIHARDPGNLAVDSTDPKVFASINRLVREACPDIVINNSTGSSITPDGRVSFEILDALPEMASLNLGPEMVRMTMPERPPTLPHPASAYVYDESLPWTYGLLERLAAMMKERAIKPELEVYHPGQYWVSQDLIDAGLIQPPYVHQFVMGYQTSVYATPENVVMMVRQMPKDSLFFCLGIGVFQLPMTAMAIILGGHVRVGLEDNLYASRGQKLIDNAEGVERVLRLAHELGREVATPAQAREILGLRAEPRAYS